MSNGLFDHIKLPEDPQSSRQDHRLDSFSKYEKHLIKGLDDDSIAYLIMVKEVFEGARIIKVTKQ